MRYKLQRLFRPSFSLKKSPTRSSWPIAVGSIFLGAFLMFFSSTGVLQAQTPVGSYQSGFQRQGNEISLITTNAHVQIDFYTPSMFRVQVNWSGDSFSNDDHLMVIRYQWPEVEIQASDEGDHFLLHTKKMNVLIHKSPFRITVKSLDGRVVSSGLSGMNANDTSLGAWKNSDSVGLRKVMLPGEHFYGFGERMGFIDQRGKKLHLSVGRGDADSHMLGAYNVMEANYSPIPFFMSTRGYGIFFHNSYRTTWDMGHSDSDSYAFKAAGGQLDYYFIYGPGFPQILDQYTEVTGKSPLMPKFAYGLHVGTYSGGTWGYEKYTSDSYVISLARKLRSRNIPADILWLDSTWRTFGELLGSGGTTFEWRHTFHNPAAMIDSLYALNFNMVGLHIRPFLDNGDELQLLDKAREHGGVLYPADGQLGKIVNFFDSSAVDWWWNHGAMKVASIGAMFFKTDVGSAFRYYGDGGDKALQQKVDSLHNLFPLAYARAAYQKFKQYNNMRGLVHTREGYAGIQRYPYIWAGDWPSRWQYFDNVIKAGLNIGLSGVGNWAHNMGGFEEKPDPELYIRWVQFGMFSPVATLFGMDHPGYKEPWSYGKKALKNFRKYDRLRYRLIPYIYTTAYQNYKTGLPLMRALVLEYQNDVNTYNIGDQYLFGDFMMICPVTTKDAKSRVVYLPEGIWYNYWTGEKIKGKQHITVPAPLFKMPIFIKAGAIIPMQEPREYIGQEPVDTLTLDIYPGENSSYSIYDDDGTSLAYQEGVYALTKVETRNEEDQFEVVIHSPVGEYQVPKRSYKLTIHMVDLPKMVSANGNDLSSVASLKDYKGSNTPGWYYNENEKVLYVRPGANSSEKITLSIHK